MSDKGVSEADKKNLKREREEAMSDEYIYKESEEAKKERRNIARLEHIASLARAVDKRIRERTAPSVPDARERVAEELRDQVEDMIVRTRSYEGSGLLLRVEDGCPRESVREVL